VDPQSGEAYSHWLDPADRVDLAVANVLRITSVAPSQWGHASGSSRSEIDRSSLVT